MLQHSTQAVQVVCTGCLPPDHWWHMLGASAENESQSRQACALGPGHEAVLPEGGNYLSFYLHVIGSPGFGASPVRTVPLHTSHSVKADESL